MRLTLQTFVASIVAFVLTSGAAHAHFLWATVENNRVRFALLENVAEAPNPQFEKYVAGIAAHSGDGKKLSLGAPENGARYAVLPAEQNVASVDSAVGVRDREGEVYLLVYHAKGAASLAAAGTDTKDTDEIRARRDGKELVVTVEQGGWRSPNNEVWVQFPGTETPVSVRTDVAGEARIALPESVPAGLVGVRAMLTDKKSGTNAGKKYAAVHRWTTLTFPMEGVTPETPFTKTLRSSFGSFHETVSGAAFNVTVFDGNLTKEQLIVHLQQRALIHNETHRVLIGASPSLFVPYGAEQKKVLTLLFADLVGMGSGWPTEAQARPTTQAFLQEIRDSEKKSPYFALGVQHVYFGGITNGGKMIGEKIGETLPVPLSYYRDSDGYAPYLAEVNKITDAEARAEMIRGGQAAYRYIAASSNEDIFKSTK